MPQILVIQESFYKALNKEKNLEILNSLGVSSAHEFFTKVIEKLNEEFAFLEIEAYRFALTPEDKKGLHQYSGFIDGKHMCVEAPRTGLNIREREFTFTDTMRIRRLV